MHSTDISNLRKLVQAKRRELHEAEYALKVVKKLLGHSDVVDIDRLYYESAEVKKTLRQWVERVIKAFEGREFNVLHIESALKRSGVTLNGIAPRARISATLKKLEASGLIQKTFDGKGNMPHRYKASNAD